MADGKFTSFFLQAVYGLYESRQRKKRISEKAEEHLALVGKIAAAEADHRPITLFGPEPSPVPPTGVGMPTTDETVYELKRRLGKELYRIELDLLAGCKINGKPCDCCHDKHHFGIEATAEELIPMDRDPVYQELINWYNEHLPFFTTEAVASGEHEDQFPIWASEIRGFIKRVMGTEGIELVEVVEEIVESDEDE